MRIVTLVHVSSKVMHKLLLHLTLSLDLLVGKLDGLKHIVLADLVHLALDHHDILLGGGNHELKVGIFHLRETRVDYKFTVNPAYTYL